MQFINYAYDFIPYFIFMVFILILLFIRGKIKQKLFIDIGIIISFTIFAGIKRPFTGDLQNYVELYNREQLNFIFIEPFFIFIKYLSHITFNNVIFLFMVYQFFTITFIIIGLRLFTKKNNFFFSLGLFFYLSIPFLFLNSFAVEIRQLLAISISFVGVYYLLKKNYKIYILLVFMAFLVHYTSIVANILYVLIYILFNNRSRKVYLFLLTINIITFVIAILFPGIYEFIFGYILNLLGGSKYSGYLLYTTKVPFLKLFIYNLISIITIISLYLKWNSFNYDIKKIIIFFSSSVIMLNILSEHSQATRLLYYFFILQIIFIPYFIYIFKEKFLVLFLIITFYILQFIYGLLYISPYGDHVFLPYKGFNVYLFDTKVKETK